VTFRYKDYADGRRGKTLTLAAEEFLRRWVQHVLPQGFVKIQHYGLLANRQRAQKLQLSRRLLLLVTVAAVLGRAAPAAGAEAPAMEPAALPRCPQCGGCRLVRLELPPPVGLEPSPAGGLVRAATGNTS
jgi:hypothetical protein